MKHVFEVTYTSGSISTLTATQTSSLNECISSWFEQNESKPEELTAILGNLHFNRDANFLMIHHGLMAMKASDLEKDSNLESFFTSTTFDPATGDENYIVIPSNLGPLRVAWWPIIILNVFRSTPEVTEKTDPSTLEFVSHRLGDNDLFRLRPFGSEKLFYSINDELLAQALGGKNKDVVPVDDPDYEQVTEFINDVYRFGWTGLEFTPIWRG